MNPNKHRGSSTRGGLMIHHRQSDMNGTSGFTPGTIIYTDGPAKTAHLARKTAFWLRSGRTAEGILTSTRLADRRTLADFPGVIESSVLLSTCRRMQAKGAVAADVGHGLVVLRRRKLHVGEGLTGRYNGEACRKTGKLGATSPVSVHRRSAGCISGVVLSNR